MGFQYPVAALKGPGIGRYTSSINGSALTQNASTSDPFRVALAWWVPANATRCRFKIRNIASLLGTQAAAIAGVATAYGKPNAGATDYAVAPTEVNGITIPGGGGFYTGPWFDPTSLRNAAGKIMFSYCIPAGAEIYYDALNVGFINYAAGSVSAYPLTGVAAAGNAICTVYLEIDSYVPRWTVVGDSISLGFTCTLLDDCAYRLLQTTDGIAVASAGISGVSLQNFADYVSKPWLIDYIDFAGSAVILQAGINDLMTRTVAEMQTDFATIVTHLRAVGASGRIVAPTITPSASRVAADANRVTYNTWLGTLPHGIYSAPDVSTAVEDSGDPTLLDAAYTTDNNHPNSAGHAVMHPVIFAGM